MTKLIIRDYMKKIIKFNILLFFLISIFVIRIPFAFAAGDYYANVNTTSGNNLVISLSKIISSNTVDVGYSGLWDAYKTTDCRPGTNIVWDMYSNEEYDVVTGHSGSYSQEGDMYNREHSVPQSWFGERSPMKADLFHVYPTDGKVNGMRSSYVYGETDSPTYTSKNGSKLGSSSFSGYSGTVFEPIDEYKGDFARTYFYMATRYYDQLSTWTAGEAQKVFQGSYPYLTEYAVNLFTKWNALDPVSEKEINRNDAVYSLQKNRNPYIDHPEYISLIWQSEYNGKSENVKAVENLINSIPKDITFADKAAIQAANDAYNALSEADKALVDNKDQLTTALSMLEALNQTSFTSSATMASFIVDYNANLDPVNVDLRFGGRIPRDAYHLDASYGVLITTSSGLNLNAIYENISLDEFMAQNTSFRSVQCDPVCVNSLGEEDENGNYYQFAWVIDDTEGYYDTYLTAYIYMEYKGSLYLGVVKSHSVQSVAQYYYDHQVELNLTPDQIVVVEKLIGEKTIGSVLPGDTIKDFWK